MVARTTTRLGVWRTLHDDEGGEVEIVALGLKPEPNPDGEQRWSILYAARNPTNHVVTLDMHNEASLLVDQQGREYGVDWDAYWAHGLHLAPGEGRVAKVVFDATSDVQPSRWDLTLSNGHAQDHCT